MTVKSIIGECLNKMGLKDFTGNDSYTDDEKELISGLLSAINLAYNQVICEYLPLTVSESVTFLNKQFLVKDLAKTIIYPIRLTKGEKVVAFKSYPDRICAEVEGDAELEYAYQPSSPLALGSRITDMRLTQSALSDGALAEYYFANKVFDLAKSFDTSFRSKLGFLRYKGKSLMLKERRWGA